MHPYHEYLVIFKVLDWIYSLFPSGRRWFVQFCDVRGHCLYSLTNKVVFLHKHEDSGWKILIRWSLHSHLASHSDGSETEQKTLVAPRLGTIHMKLTAHKLNQADDTWYVTVLFFYSQS